MSLECVFYIRLTLQIFAVCIFFDNNCFLSETSQFVLRVTLRPLAMFTPAYFVHAH